MHEDVCESQIKHGRGGGMGDTSNSVVLPGNVEFTWHRPHTNAGAVNHSDIYGACLAKWNASTDRQTHMFRAFSIRFLRVGDNCLITQITRRADISRAAGLIWKTIFGRSFGRLWNFKVLTERRRI